jgi:hypothetical protein
MEPNKRTRLADDAEAQPWVRKVFRVHWDLNISIKEFREGVFADCRYDERQECVALFREIENAESGTSEVAYNTVEKANIAALSKFEELKKRIGDSADNVKCIGDNDDDEDGNDEEEEERDVDEEPTKLVKISQNEDGLKSWSWSFTSDDAYENTVLHEGSVHIEMIRVE